MAIDDVAHGNSSLATNVSTQMSSVQELGANIDESDNEIATMKTVTETTVELSKQARQLMDELIDIKNQTKENVDSIHLQSQENVDAADEIRQLADNSAQQTNNIKDIIQILIGNIEDTNIISNNLVASANTQLEKLDVTKQTFVDVIDKIEAIEENVVTISGNMDGLASVATELENTANALKTAVSYFKN